MVTTTASPAPQLAREGGRSGFSPLAVHVLKGAGGFLIAALAWEFLRLVNVLPSEWAPSVIAVVRSMVTGLVNGSLVAPMLETLTAWVAGLLIAVVIGIAWGLAVGANRLVADCSRVLISVMRPIPSVALIPIAILIAGLGLRMALMVVVFAAIWPVLFNTMYGVREVPEQYQDTSKALGHSASWTLFRVTLIAALPSITTGVRVSASIALVVTMGTELMTGIGGLGGYVLNSRIIGQVASSYAGLLLGGILGIAVNLIFQTAQKRFLGWSPDNRRSSE